ncbi:GTPase [Vibrio sp. UCD-FRSSP16_10]|uniref:CobW family GTP-binding protein n=1 Tax=unclassified Vibrio TaxID=2614977 RepID=UPI0008003D86|nr:MULTISPECIES: GTP-binding protein [unclassified Vibrio]OBT15492.1 GTPase [Vibrio sp. UCD-FRSSP16_30]OBT20565.1 GTPase [Vibrio sp. UCD-FRSSP16_10]
MSNKTPTNIITGFLGTGKTTAILNLLKNKPENEKWAVLVNEFGEIGIDGALMSEQGAIIKEVPGGCMCCTAGVPMSVGLNMLLRQKPDRLLIEPTGLGHPKEVMATLTSDQYLPYIELRTTMTMTDARYFDDEKYTSNDNFQQQLAVADIVVANKTELATQAQNDNMQVWLAEQGFTYRVVNTSNGQLETELLDEVIQANVNIEIEAHHHHHAAMEPQFGIPPNQKFVRKENKGQGYFSCGWLFGPEVTFPFDDIFSLFSDLTAERIKAVINTEKGCFAFNVADGTVSVNEMSLEGFESRMEVIDSQLMPWDQLEGILLTLAGLSASDAVTEQ